jgi:UDP-N-acetylglucosamine--dolichyl-phosphate N-acetylglucosaminephosphotransferase
MFSLGIYTLTLGRFEASIIAFTTCFSLLAFLRWNWYPAKFLPGDSLTYLIGASFASVVIIGNVERFGIIIFIPWIIEAFLKLRSGFRARSLGNLQSDGTLKAPYSKTYSLTHLVMKIRPFRERTVTAIIMGIEILFCLLAFAFV